MFKKEALWIAHVLAQEILEPDALVIDVGSSSEEYRCFYQPAIDYYVFKPLRERGCQIIYSDAQPASGVGLVFDFAGPSCAEKALTDYWGKCNVVLCANLLEHVVDRGIVVERLKKLSAPQCLIILTVPNRFCYHAHPIDTMYRPNNKDLEVLFNGSEYTVIASDVIEVEELPEKVPFDFLHRMLDRGLRVFKFFTGVGPGRLEPRFLANRVAVIAVRKK